MNINQPKPVACCVGAYATPKQIAKSIYKHPERAVKCESDMKKEEKKPEAESASKSKGESATKAVRMSVAEFVRNNLEE